MFYSDPYTSAVAMAHGFLSRKLKEATRIIDLDDLKMDIGLFLKSTSGAEHEKFQKLYDDYDALSEIYSIASNIEMTTNDPVVEELAERLAVLKFGQKLIPDSHFKYAKTMSIDDEDDDNSMGLMESIGSELSSLSVESGTGDFISMRELAVYEDADMEIPYKLLVSSS